MGPKLPEGERVAAVRVSHLERHRRVAPDGTVTTFATIGLPADIAIAPDGRMIVSGARTYQVFALDGAGNATVVAGVAVANLNLPWVVAADATGNVFIAEVRGHRVRKVNPSGIITTLAGSGDAGFSGDGGPPEQAQLSEPRGVSLDGQSWPCPSAGRIPRTWVTRSPSPSPSPSMAPFRPPAPP